MKKSAPVSPLRAATRDLFADLPIYIQSALVTMIVASRTPSTPSPRNLRKYYTAEQWAEKQRRANLAEGR